MFLPWLKAKKSPVSHKHWYLPSTVKRKTSLVEALVETFGVINITFIDQSCSWLSPLRRVKLGAAWAGFTYMGPSDCVGGTLAGSWPVPLQGCFTSSLKGCGDLRRVLGNYRRTTLHPSSKKDKEEDLGNCRAGKPNLDAREESPQKSFLGIWRT